MICRNAMLKLSLYGIAVCIASGAFAAPRWSVEKAREWAAANPWWCGVNYIPANAINYTAMWDKTSFSPEVIRKELALMTDMGMNCVRFVMQYKVYEDDPEYFIKTLDRFLALCEEAKVKAMPIFFDDCAFGANRDPVIGRQPEPLEGWYAWAWSPSPGHTMVIDEREHPKLEKYVKDVIGRFKDDKRIFLWDLYNEPTNGGLEFRSIPLLRKTFKWAREVNPSQPISSGIFRADKTLNDILFDNSDIITFHIYDNPKKTAARIREMQSRGRPVICTEWMNRPRGSTVKGCLKLFADAGVGCMLWGLVNGKTQTHLRWRHRPENLPYKGVWQHDLFRGDFTPYDKDEINLIKSTCAAHRTVDRRVLGGDPFIHVENGMYYMYCSHRCEEGFVVYTSTDLREWKAYQGRDKNGFVYVKGNGFGQHKFWAPEMHKYKGRYYLFHSAEEKVTVDVSDSPLGPFTNPEKKPYLPEGNIDNSLFVDDDGTPYMLYAHFHAGNEVWMCELEKDLMHAKPETQRKLVRAEEKWEMDYANPKLSSWSIAEGPCLVKHDGLYYLTYSSHHVADFNYNVCLATAPSIKGPWTKQGKAPILAPRGDLLCTGHHSLFKDLSGNWKIVFHVRDHVPQFVRYLYTADVKFTTKDGHPWIEVGEYRPCLLKE